VKRLLSLLALSVFVFAASARAADLPKPTGVAFARTFPYSMVGQLIFTSGNSDYLGSGTVIKPASVLTAAHNLWDLRGGFSTDLLFSRSQYGASALSEQHASRIYVFAGYRESARRVGAESVRTFSSDMGALLFPKAVAGGATAGWWANPSLLNGVYAMRALGYGAVVHTGDDLLSVVPTRGFFSTYGAFYENTSIDIEAGMSGGPVFARGTDGKWYVAAVIVAGSDRPVAGGVRVLNSAAATFIKTYMR
jgi:hypothetical protein